MEVQGKPGVILVLSLAMTLAACAGRRADVLGRFSDHRISKADSETSVQVTFMGTTTLLFRDKDHALLIDGFFTRPRKMRVLFGLVAPDAGVVDTELKRAGIEQLDAIYVAHSHYDHALDVGVVARITGGTVYGSGSTANIASTAGVPAIRVTSPPKSATFGDFTVQAFHSLHSPDARYPGRIDAPLRPPARVSAYKEGCSYTFLIEHGGQRFLVHPSANFVEGMYEGVRADVIFLSVGTLGKQSSEFINTYWNEAVVKTGATLVVPIHWDDFTIPVTDPLRLTPRPFDDVVRAMTEIKRLAGGRIRVANPPIFTPMDVCRNLPCARRGVSYAPLHIPDTAGSHL
jgi:L-ascorbate metabolism protein UlaG (beta-lactamase superfamily)